MRRAGVGYLFEIGMEGVFGVLGLDVHIGFVDAAGVGGVVFSVGATLYRLLSDHRDGVTRRPGSAAPHRPGPFR